MKLSKLTAFSASAATLMLVSSQVFAHPGHDTGNSPLLNGLLHPFTGTDHLLALTGLGAVAALLTRTGATRNLLAMITALTIGAIGGLLSSTASQLELLVGLSLLALPALLISHRGGQLAQQLALSAALLFSLAHGAVQGSESAGMLSTIAGLLTSSSLLLAAGYSAARTALSKMPTQVPVRIRKD